MLSKRAGVVVAVLRRPRLLLAFTAAVFVGLVVAAPASAEWFGDVYIGGAFTSKQDVEVNAPGFPTLTVLDVEFDSSASGGGRVGYWWGAPLPFLGLGLDISYFAPNVGAQTRTFCAFGCVSSPFGALDLSVTVIGFDAMFRYPMMTTQQYPNGQLQPYFTLGPAVFIAHAEDTNNFFPFNQSDTDTKLGLKLGLGATWLFTKEIGMFGEYRFTHFSPEFTFTDSVLGTSTLSTNVNTHHFLAGVSFRF